MSTYTDAPIPPVPQTGRVAEPTTSVESKNLWQQLLATFSEVGNAIDPFASDVHPDVRALGRRARQRNPRVADDYFALGDMCARLTLDDLYLNQSYAEKTLLAYMRAGECSPEDNIVAHRAIMAFALWTVEVARVLASYTALQVGVLVCERALQFPAIAADEMSSKQLNEVLEQMRAQMTRMMDEVESPPGSGDPNEVTPQKLSQKLCDEGQMLLRQQQPAEALAAFARAIEADDQNSVAWLWQALALTDVARFEEALQSYERAIELDPENYGAWNSKGALLLELGRVEEALDSFEHALAMPLPPAVVKAAFLLNKGKALYTLGRYQEARAALVESDQLDPTPESAGGIVACDEMLAKTQAVNDPPQADNTPSQADNSQ